MKNINPRTPTKKLVETTTPTAISSVGQIYTKSDNKFYFQDGAGNEHEVQLVSHYHAEMYIYDDATGTTINVADQYHAIQGLFSQGEIANFTFSAGDSGSGNITTADGGAAINIADVGHGLVSGDYVQIQSANHTGSVEVTRIDDDNFTVPIAYVGDETGYWQQGDRLVAGTGAAGTYQFGFSTSLLSDGNGKTYKFELCKNTTHIDESACERKIGTGADVGSMGSCGIVTIAEGDEITLIVKNTADATDLTLKHANLNMHRI